MIITYLRSSSLNAWEFCPMRYLIEYNLGWGQPAKVSTQKGTIVHKILEILAVIKKAKQDGIKQFDDEVVGRIRPSKYSLEKIIDKCYDYYVKHSHNKFTEKDREDCRLWVKKALEYRNGEYNPKNQNIVSPEQQFDIVVTKPWAKYSYDYKGETLEGYLKLMGTIDLVIKVNDNTYKIIDYKTGARKNWSTGKEKDFSAIQKDKQLMFYYYACHHLYPEIENIMIDIFFINDGGVFPAVFSKSKIPEIEDMIRKTFEEIKNTEIPKTKKDWQCSSFCTFGKTSFENTHLPVLSTEDDTRHYSKRGRLCWGSAPNEPMTMCEEVDYCLKRRPFNKVIKNMSNPEFKIDRYQAPGEV